MLRTFCILWYPDSVKLHMFWLKLYTQVSSPVKKLSKVFFVYFIYNFGNFFAFSIRLSQNKWGNHLAFIVLSFNFFPKFHEHVLTTVFFIRINCLIIYLASFCKISGISTLTIGCNFCRALKVSRIQRRVNVVSVSFSQDFND